MWANNDEWNNYPKHMLETKRILPSEDVDLMPLKEIKDKKRKSDYYTRFLRKKFQLNTSYMR